ncbi:CHAT domain-containing protein [Xylaria palmicola]|nr:CHAT domain-containing protein [Xylaria palmicola]
MDPAMESHAVEPFIIDVDMLQLLGEMDIDDLNDFSTAYSDGISERDTELFIFCNFLLFKRTTSSDRLDVAISRAHDFLQSTPPGHPDRPRRVAIQSHLEGALRDANAPSSSQLSDTLNSHLARSTARATSFIDAMGGIDVQSVDGIERTIRMLESLPIEKDDPQTAWILAYLSASLANQTREERHLDSAIVYSERAAGNSAFEPEKLVVIFQNLRVFYCERHVRLGDADYLDQAIGAAEMVVALMSSEDRDDKADQLWLLAHLLMDRHRLSIPMGETYNIDQAIESMEQAAILSHTNHEKHAERHEFLAKLQLERFEITMADVDLNLAIQRFEAMLEITSDPEGHLRYLRVLFKFYRERFRRHESLEDLARPVELAENLLAALPQDDDSGAREGFLQELEACLRYQYDHNQKDEYISRAIEVINTALTVNPDQIQWDDYFGLLGGWYMRRFQITGDIRDLNSSIDAIEKAMVINPDGDGHITNWAGLLSTRFEATGNRSDLDLAIEATERKLEKKSHDDPRRYIDLINLSSLIGLRASEYGREQEGPDSDKDRCLKLSREAIDCSPPSGNCRVACLTNYANQLQHMHGITHSSTDLDRAAEAAKMALDAVPPDYDDLDNVLTNVALIRMKQVSKTQVWSAEDLAIVGDHLERALTAIYKTHERRPTILHYLATFLSIRSAYVDEVSCRADLRRAREPLEEALALVGNANRSVRFNCLSSLGLVSRQLFKETGDAGDLEQVLHFDQMALQEISPSHEKWAQICWALAEDFRMRGKSGDLATALNLLRQGWLAPNSTSFLRLICARDASEIEGSQSNWAEARSWLEGAVEMLPAISPRSLKADDQQQMLGKFTGLACQAASVALRAGNPPYEALKSLEAGRGVIAGLLMEMRIDISDLEDQHPALASRFLALRDALDVTVKEPSRDLMPMTSLSSSLRPESRWSRDVDAEFKQVISQIRLLPDFEEFLLPPSAEECMSAARLGPIVAINVSIYGCDALLVEGHQIRSLKLDKLQYSELNDKVRDMKRFGINSEILEWLWDVAAGPILDELGFHTPPPDDKWPHVWWILTGALSHLPIHAAGYHGNFSNDNVLDRVMSSYTSSMKALIRRRQNNPDEAEVTKTAMQGDSPSEAAGQEKGSHRALLVAMPDTPGISSRLPYAAKEVEIVKKICSSMNILPVQPPTRRREILEEMGSCKVFHFAGHGQSQRMDPSESCILLDDWMTDPLTVTGLRLLKFHQNPPFLGFLSACLTTVNDAEDLIDEGIHLSGAFHLAGFRNIVGTLWEVSDSHCVDVARVVYETLRDVGLTDHAVCLGLHHAVRALRDGDVTREDEDNVSSSLQCGTSPTEGAVGEQIDHTEGKEVDRSNREWRPAELLEPTSVSWQPPTQEHPRYWAPYIHFG